MTTDTTTSAVERLDIYLDDFDQLTMVQTADGEYVLASDYDTLAAENARLKEDREAADHDLVDRYRDPKSGMFSFPGDVAAIVRAFDKSEAENARLRAASAAGWIAGRDYVNGWLQRAGIAGDGDGDPLADCIRALTPPADDKAALNAMIAEARRDDLAVIKSLQQRLRAIVAFIDKGHVGMARNVADIQKDQNQ